MVVNGLFFREDEVVSQSSLGKNYFLMDVWVFELFKKQKQYIPGGGKFDRVQHLKLLDVVSGELKPKVFVVFHPSIRRFVSKSIQAVFKKIHLEAKKGKFYGA